MKKSNDSSPITSSSLGEEINQGRSPASSSEVGESASPPYEASPSESGAWLTFGVPGQRRIALLRATVSSMLWGASPHSLRLNTQQDGVILLDLAALDLVSGQALWQGLVDASGNGAETPFEVLHEQ